MATATTNLLFQTNPLKWKQCYPNRFRLLRPLSAQPVKLSATFNQIKLQSLEKSRLIATNPKSKSAAESLQYRPAENPETCVVNKLWKYARKPVTTAAVLLGVLLLMYRPKPALASSVGRVRATCSPYDSADTESQLRYIDARDYSMSRTSVDTMGWVLYPYALYYGALAALFVMCRLLKCLDPSVLEWFKRQVKFLFLIVIIHRMWATRHNPSTVVKLQLQVNLSNAGRALQTDLNRIAETANTSTYTGVNSILTETAGTFLRHPDCFISASSYVAGKYGRDGAQNYLDQLSLEERIKLSEKPLVNVKNLKAESSTSQKSPNEIQDEYMEVNENQLDIKAESSTSQKSANEIQDEYMEVNDNQLDINAESSTSQKSANDIQDGCMKVIILVAVVGKHEFPTINSWDDLKEVLQLLTSIDPDDGIYAYGVEVLWSPQSSSSWGWRRWFK
ncbi:uncharacterized protein LOC133739866 [Rosa rugosa]|uniref:uncharacterized protein LOC133739866 n=1 Tax=Rosa rugosa TaxID=74645 RepID=UPI002B4161D0|nr:uncharacterized protein LOC133739866 [Rosa rugosa]